MCHSETLNIYKTEKLFSNKTAKCETVGFFSTFPYGEYVRCGPLMSDLEQAGLHGLSAYLQSLPRMEQTELAAQLRHLGVASLAGRFG